VTIGYDYFGNDLLNGRINVATVDQCVNACLAWVINLGGEACTHFSYAPLDGNCFLKSYGDEESLIEKDWMMTGRCTSEAPETIPASTLLQTPSPTPTPTLPPTLAPTTPDPTTTAAPAIVVIVGVGVGVVGATEPKSSGCVLTAGWDYPGNDISGGQKIFSTVEKCGNKCLEWVTTKATCTHFSYIPGTGNCYLKSAGNAADLVAASYMIGGHCTRTDQTTTVAPPATIIDPTTPTTQVDTDSTSDTCEQFGHLVTTSFLVKPRKGRDIYQALADKAYTLDECVQQCMDARINDGLDCQGATLNLVNKRCLLLKSNAVYRVRMSYSHKTRMWIPGCDIDGEADAQWREIMSDDSVFRGVTGSGSGSAKHSGAASP
jgi:hypothetical protein